MNSPHDKMAWDRLKADVRRAADGVDLYGRLHPDPAGNIRDGGSVRCIAPDHDDSDPSMSLHEDGFKCHACGASGDVFDMWAVAYGRETDGEDFKKTVLELADDCGLDPDNYTRGDAEAPDVDSPKAPPPRGAVRRGESPTSAGRTHTPPDDRLTVMRRIWKITRPLSLSDAARRWLESRSIPPPVAQAYGARDWHAKMGAIFDALRDFEINELHRAGMVNGDGEAWWPLRTYLDDDRSPCRGLAVPVWHPDHREAPIAIRWRTFDPGEDFPPKSLQQPSGPGSFRPPPLGLLEPSPVDQLMLEAPWLDAHVNTDTARVWLDEEAPRPIGGYPRHYAVVLCEGETDWLSVAAAALEVDTDIRVVPVGLTTKAAALSDTTLDTIAGADHIHAALDGDQADESAEWFQRCSEVANGLVARHGPGAEKRFTFTTYPEDCDLNDLRSVGKLTGRLDSWIRGDV